MEIKLLAAPVDLPLTSQVNADSTSLVPINRLAVATQPLSRNDTGYPDDDFVWSATAEEDGSFYFHALPFENSGNDQASSTWGGATSAGMSSSVWLAMTTRYAVAQYGLHASMTSAMYGHSLDIYA